jgi:hypothetical protein
MFSRGARRKRWPLRRLPWGDVCPILLPMRCRRVVNTVVAMLLLGAIYADVVSGHCDMPLAAGAGAVVASATNGEARADLCSSGCVPDCFSCSRSEEPAPALVPAGPRDLVLAFVEPETCARDGVLPLPYHPPLGLL